MSNLLVAIKNLITNPITDIRTFYVSSNRANAVWDSLEHYVKDLFCNSFRSSDSERNQKYSEVFSYLWNQNNPPDIILKNSDAIEVKKIENMGSAIALNSSYPKNKLYRTDTRITEACRNCEENQWTEKDILYVIGAVLNNVLRSLWFIYGDCYAASPSIYQRIADRISQGVADLKDIELVETNELAKVKKVDPLGITDLRVRWMWHIENPWKVFQEFINHDIQSTFSAYTLLLKEKYQSFPEEDRKELEELNFSWFQIQDVQIRSPNNPAQLLEAKLISYVR